MNSKNEDPRVDLSWKRYLLPPIHKEGYRFVALFGVLALGLYLIWWPLILIGLVLTAFSFYFFRN
ncbi:MAG: hypothetical protein J6P93_05485, partial [Alphaproteobacteria bacterium]|nr:hypothetical protein [Alphaproteobacteria bacterium]